MPFSFPRPARLVLLTLFVPCTLPCCLNQTQAADSQPQPVEAGDAARARLPAPLVLDDPPEPLPAASRQTEAEQDLAHALALYATGRTLQLQGDRAKAVGYYQRAIRYDPTALVAAKAFVRLAIDLNRQDEAVRVALKIQDSQTLGPMSWMKLGVHLIRKGDWQRAALMYEKVLASRTNTRPSAADVALKMEMGRLYNLIGDSPKAAECFVQVMDALDKPQQFGLDESGKKELLGDDPARTYLNMGECFLATKKLDRAANAFEESHRIGPNKGLLTYNLARIEAESGKPERALAKLRSCFDERVADKGMEPYRLLARILKDLDREEELTGQLEQLHSDDPNNVPLGYFLAETHQKSGRLDEAKAMYRDLIEKSPTMTGYRSLIAICRETEPADKLLDALGQAAAKGLTVDSLGEAGRSISQDADLVRNLIEIAEKQFQADPDKLDYNRRLAVALLALSGKQFDAAGQFFDLAIDADPSKSSELLLTWGLGLLAEERFDEAAKLFQRGVDAQDEDGKPVFYYYLAGALEMSDRSEEALSAAQKAVEGNQDSPRFRAREAWIFYHDDQLQKATEAYAGLVEKFDADFGSAETRQVMRECRLVLSNLAVMAKELAKAEEWLEQVLDEFPDDIGALNDLGYLWADQNVRLQRAHRMIRQAVEGDPENAAYRDSLGWVLYRLGNTDEALVELLQAAESDPDPVILDHLGDVYHSAGKSQQAGDVWRRAVEAFKQAGKTEEAEAVRKKTDQNMKVEA